MSDAAKKAERPKLEMLHAPTNQAYADALLELAARIEASPYPATAYGAVVVFADGTHGQEFGGVSEHALVGALESVQQDILAGWKNIPR